MQPSYYRSSSSWIGLGPWSASPWGAPYVGHDRQSLRRSQRVGEDTQSQGLGFTPPSTVVTPDTGPIGFPKPTYPSQQVLTPAELSKLQGQMAGYAKTEGEAAKQASSLHDARRYSEAVPFWRTAQHFAELQAQLSSMWPQADLEKGAKLVNAAGRAAGYAKLAETDAQLGSGTLLSPNGKNLFGPNGAYLGDAPAVPPDPSPGMPLWAWLVAGAAAVYGVVKYVL